MTLDLDVIRQLLPKLSKLYDSKFIVRRRSYVI